MSWDDDVWPNALIRARDALFLPHIGSEPAHALLVEIAPTRNVPIRVARQIVGSIDQPVAIVVLAITHLDAADRARVFAPRRVGLVEIDPARAARRNGALCIDHRAGFTRAGRRCTTGRSMEHAACTTARTAMLGARTKVDVVVDVSIAIVVFAIARGVALSNRHAGIFATAISIEVVISERTCAARTRSRFGAGIGAR